MVVDSVSQQITQMPNCSGEYLTHSPDGLIKKKKKRLAYQQSQGSLFISPNRKTKASKATRILIHLVCAMFLLNFTFLINNFVANLKSSVGCKIMAALMHYFMLATFTWFAVQAFHLCLQLHVRGNIAIRRYVLKVTIISWSEYTSFFLWTWHLQFSG